VNVETREKTWGGLTDAQRIENYQTIVAMMTTLGIHCCATDPAAAEKEVDAGLKGAE
jgi:hypothetical protein